MTPKIPKRTKHSVAMVPPDYDSVLTGMVDLLEQARRASARAVNALMTATYWEIGRRIVEFEQGGKKRAGYGEELLKRLAVDLTARFGRGFGVVNLSYMKRFYLSWPLVEIFQAVSEKSRGSILQTMSEKFNSAREAIPQISETLSRRSVMRRTFGWSGPIKPNTTAFTQDYDLLVSPVSFDHRSAVGQDKGPFLVIRARWQSKPLRPPDINLRMMKR